MHHTMARVLALIATAAFVSVLTGCPDVVGESSGGGGGFSGSPPAVTGLSAAASDGTVTLTWDPASFDGHTGYSMAYAATGNPPAVYGGELNPSGTVVAGLTNGVEYTFLVQNVRRDGALSAPQTVTATPTGGGGSAPTVTLTATATEVANGAPAVLTATANDPDGDALTYAWFVDSVLQAGETGSTFTLVRTPAAEQSYTVRVEVSDGTFTTNDELTITVLAPGSSSPTVSIATAFTEVELTSTLEVTADASDPDNNLDPVYQWDIDGAALPDQGATIVLDPSQTPINDTLGSYTLTVTVTDLDGNVASASRQFDVVAFNEPPVAQAVFAFSYQLGLAYEFDGSNSSDPDGTIVGWSWDFDGDGVEDASGEVVNWTFSEATSRRIRLIVTDDRGKTHEDSEFVDVLTPPSASVSVNAVTVYSGVPVEFDASGSTPPSGNTLSRFRFDFDDSDGVDLDAPDRQIDLPETSTVWRFDAPGTYTVTLQVATDHPQTIDTTTLEVTVLDGFTSIGGPDVLELNLYDLAFDSSGTVYLAHTFDANPEPFTFFNKADVSEYDDGSGTWSRVGPSSDTDGIGSGWIRPRVLVDSNGTLWHRHQWSEFYLDLFRFTGSDWLLEDRQDSDTQAGIDFDIGADASGRVFYAYAEEPSGLLTVRWATPGQSGYVGGAAGRTIGDPAGSDTGITGLDAGDVSLTIDSAGMLYVAFTNNDTGTSHVSVYRFDTTGDLAVDSWEVVDSEAFTSAFNDQDVYYTDIAALGSDIYLLASQYDGTSLPDAVFRWDGSSWSQVGSATDGFAVSSTQSRLVAAGADRLVYGTNSPDGVIWWLYDGTSWTEMFGGAPLSSSGYPATADVFYDAANDRVYGFAERTVRYTTEHR